MADGDPPEAPVDHSRCCKILLDFLLKAATVFSLHRAGVLTKVSGHPGLRTTGKLQQAAPQPATLEKDL
jgi:hypothetical protein